MFEIIFHLDLLGQWVFKQSVSIQIPSSYVIWERSLVNIEMGHGDHQYRLKIDVTDLNNNSYID